jgi:hypothetical protein
MRHGALVFTAIILFDWLVNYGPWFVGSFPWGLHTAWAAHALWGLPWLELGGDLVAGSLLGGLAGAVVYLVCIYFPAA